MQNKIFLKSNKGSIPTRLVEPKRIEHYKEPARARKNLPGILVVTSYPPRICGIATYSKDLEDAFNEKFGNSLAIFICPLEARYDNNSYPDGMHPLKTNYKDAFLDAAHAINSEPNIKIVLIQHEFGLFKENEEAFFEFLQVLQKPVVLTFHTVLPNPDIALLHKVKLIASLSDTLIVMTDRSGKILRDEYQIPAEKINVIPHGTHLVHRADKVQLKKKYGLSGKIVLTNFGLLGPGKSIETTLDALPGIVDNFPNTIFLILGKTHPIILREEGELYREFLVKKVKELNLGDHVRFVDQYLPIKDLLEYLQLTDVYLFTSKDPNQAVSGTFSYALSCGCPIISTPIPQAQEVLQNEAGVVFDFMDSKQLGQHVIRLLNDKDIRRKMTLNGLQISTASAWENATIAHTRVFKKVSKGNIEFRYRKPPINLSHIKQMTTAVGMIQFSRFNKPDIESGYTLDDNARALIAMVRYYKHTGDMASLELINLYFKFIVNCWRPNGKFVNYVDKYSRFTEQNFKVNLEDANGRAMWALGYLLDNSQFLKPCPRIEEQARFMLKEILPGIEHVHSPRAMAFMIKGLFYYARKTDCKLSYWMIRKFANRLVQMYCHHSTEDWQWFEGYLTYGNSSLSQALLMAYQMTANNTYKQVAKNSMDFLLSQIFDGNSIRVISNKGWFKKGHEPSNEFQGGEQPIDVSYTILALRMFDQLFPDQGYFEKMEGAFNWFLGENPLHHIIYNPCTGGCYDGLERNNVNLNQGAESTVSYLLARLAFEECHQETISLPKRINIQGSPIAKGPRTTH